ncbi:MULTISPECIES: sensor histidine kinase [Pontibacillus]|uniref:histidine kinase n=1 Tax=Pontibacillus chungwhensis TaxID=265426 RepID=A0ABY8UY20_9BACI|nr:MULTISPECIES: HAMP domain-containing sensor histidine kinase [Pontibacillus]MCD5324296.1 HAMP domain-containing histidine kinase [Pontibacillus sp. HN14]WIF97651.1 HAMP domain-containing sensor histidine kinase [Pontibacillus chungwhensis]
MIGYLLAGCVLLLLGISFPGFTHEWTAWIYENIEKSLTMSDSGSLLVTALSYAFWYFLIFYCIYIGSMFISYAVSKNRRSLFYQGLLVFLVMGSVYIFNVIHHEHYSYSIHLGLLAILLFLHNFIPEQRYFYSMFSVIILFLFFAVQWLNMVPGLTVFGIGTDDFAVSIKLADEYLTDNTLFSTISIILFAGFFLIAVIVTTILHLFSKQVTITRKYQKQTEELQEARGELFETNVYKEIHSLVHDMKTPLVTVEGLVSLIELKNEDKKVDGYFDRIYGSVNKMKDMVSEILYEETKREMEVMEVIQYVRSHLSIDDDSITVSVKVEEDLPMIEVNKIRFSRALSNMVENALRSLRETGGTLKVQAYSYAEGVAFSIKDDGPGVDPSLLEEIWEEGFSTKRSSGIGLPFVKSVVDQHGGTIDMKSTPYVETSVTVYLPVYVEEEAYDFSH